MTVHCQLYQWSNQALILCPLFVNEYIINFLSSNLHGAFLLLSSFKFHSTLHFTLSDELILFKYWRKTKKKKKERENLTSTHIALKQITLEHTEAFLYVMMMVVVLSICALAGALDQVLRVPTP